jgi:hypothetical protein
MDSNQKRILINANESEEVLSEVIGYYEYFEGDELGGMCIAITLFFGRLSFHIVVQDDDSFEIYGQDRWRPDESFQKASLARIDPWVMAKGKPLLWSWALHNQQGYLDGLQFEFAKNPMDESVVIQLVAMGNELKLRNVSNKLSSIKPTS